MVGYEIIKTIGNSTATYKFTPKYVLKVGQKVTVRHLFSVQQNSKPEKSQTSPAQWNSKLETETGLHN